MHRFIKLTDSNDQTAITLNSEYFVKATRGEDDEYTTVLLTDDYSDLEVEETPEKIYSLLNKTASSGQSLADNPETPPRAATKALTNDTHMENLAKHA